MSEPTFVKGIYPKNPTGEVAFARVAIGDVQHAASLTGKGDVKGFTLGFALPRVIWTSEDNKTAFGARAALGCIAQNYRNSDDRVNGGIIHAGPTFSRHLFSNKYVTVEFESNILVSPLQVSAQLEAGVITTLNFFGEEGGYGLKTHGLIGGYAPLPSNGDVFAGGAISIYGSAF